MPPRARGVAMMFQSYGLYPHYTVRNNISFPLRTQRVPRAEINKKVAVGVATARHRSFFSTGGRASCSGGERQRVALARALVREPTALLLDEPLSNLDAKLRTSARQEIRNFQQRVRLTTIYVTHDQVEAIGMGDRIAVIDRGGSGRWERRPNLQRSRRSICCDLCRRAADDIVTRNGSGYLDFARRISSPRA